MCNLSFHNYGNRVNKVNDEKEKKIKNLLKTNKEKERYF